MYSLNKLPLLASCHVPDTMLNVGLDTDGQGLFLPQGAWGLLRETGTSCLNSALTLCCSLPLSACVAFPVLSR